MVAVGTAQESDSAPSLNRAYRVGVASEESSAPTPTIKQPARFIFPQEGKFNAFSILRPHWRLAFSNSLTGEEAETYADEHFQEPHADPVTLSRFAELPNIYLNRHQPYRIKVLDEFRIERHRINYFLWPDTVKNLLNTGVASETNEALAVTPEKAVLQVNVGVASETNSATPLSTVLRVGVATESEAALSLINSLWAGGINGGLYDPSDLSTLYQDEAGTTPVTGTGQNVRRIEDRSGNGLHATSDDPPTLEQDGDGNYYLAFNGSSNYLATPSADLSTTAQLTVTLGVRKVDDVFGMMVGQESTIDIDGAWDVAMNSAMGEGTVDDYRPRIYNGDFSARETEENFPAPITNVVTGRFDFSQSDGDQIEARVDGAISHGAVEINASTRSGFLDAPIYIGARQGSSAHAEMRLYSLIVVGAELTAEQLQAAEAHAADKTGVTLS